MNWTTTEIYVDRMYMGLPDVQGLISGEWQNGFFLPDPKIDGTKFWLSRPIETTWTLSYVSVSCVHCTAYSIIRWYIRMPVMDWITPCQAMGGRVLFAQWELWRSGWKGDTSVSVSVGHVPCFSAELSHFPLLKLKGKTILVYTVIMLWLHSTSSLLSNA